MVNSSLAHKFPFFHLAKRKPSYWFFSVACSYIFTRFGQKPFETVLRIC